MNNNALALRALLGAALFYACAPVHAQTGFDFSAGSGVFDFGGLPDSALQPGPERRPAPRFEPLDRIVAIVNDEVVVETELNEQVFNVLNGLRASNTAAPRPEVLRRQVLERIIVERVQLQEAARSGIRIDDAALEQALGEIAQRNGLSVGQFRQALAQQGFDIPAYRERIRDEMRIARLREREIGRRVQVSERDIDNFLATNAAELRAGEQVRLRQVFIALPQAPSPEAIAAARSSLEEVREELLAGADFAERAAAVSDGAEALSGGDLGVRDLASLPPLIVEAVRDLAEGEISEIVRSPAGFHLLRVDARRDDGTSIVMQARVRHILLVPGQDLSEDEALRRLRVLRQRILVAGEDFAALARANSGDPGSALRGGDIGWVSGNEVVPRFQQTIDTLQPGTVSEPFKTRFGWHIAEVLERREFDNTAKATRTRAMERVRARKVDEEMNSWLQQLRDDAYVELRLDPA